MIAYRKRSCPLRQPRIWLWALAFALPGHVAIGYALSLNAQGSIVGCPITSPMQVALVAPKAAAPHLPTPAKAAAQPQTPVAKIAKAQPQPKLAELSPAAGSGPQKTLATAGEPTTASAPTLGILPITQIGFAAPPTPPSYPRSSRARGEEGTAMLLAKLQSAGQPVQVKLERSSGFETLDSAALAAAQSWQFNAPTTPTWVRLPVRFALN